MSTTWFVVPTCLPVIIRRCHRCGSQRFRADGRFRVNANHKLLDAWLLALCTICQDTTKLTVFERTSVRAVPPALLDRLQHNDAGLAAELLQSPIVLRRNRVRLDWEGAWRLVTGVDTCPDGAAIDVAVRFEAAISLRPLRLVADGLGLSRGETDSLVAAGRLVSSVRLGGRRSGDFSFTLSADPSAGAAVEDDRRPGSPHRSEQEQPAAPSPWRSESVPSHPLALAVRVEGAGDRVGGSRGCVRQS
jgi:hypothetical protein